MATGTTKTKARSFKSISDNSRSATSGNKNLSIGRKSQMSMKSQMASSSVLSPIKGPDKGMGTGGL